MQWKAFIHEAFSLGKIQQREITCNQRIFSVTFSPIAGKDYLNVYALDITDRRQAEEALRQGEEQRRQAQKLEAIGTLASGIAHDFNNILTAIIGYTELANTKTNTNSPIRSNLQEVLKAGSRAKDLVKQILTFSCEQPTGKRPIRLQPVIEETLKLLSASLPSTITLYKNLKKNTGPIMGDPTQIHQIIMNLGTNAEFAMRGTTGSLDVTLDEVDIDSLTADHTPGLEIGPYVRLTMADSGQGIAPEVLSRIFDPFFTTKPVGEGSGMGLSVTHGIVSDHHGAISVHSVQGSGTTFTLYFPQTVASLQESRLKIPSSIPRGEGTVLFVDDERAIVAFVKPLLEGLGYHVLAHTNSLEALEAFRSNPNTFDAIITDQTMPHCTGEMLAQEILTIRPDIPIILCSGFSHVMTKEKALSMGIRAFLLKPFSTEDLAQTIQRVLARETNQKKGPTAQSPLPAK
jgi:signal transduction histidine kinase/CheY-like chemotaxis protein